MGSTDWEKVVAPVLREMHRAEVEGRVSEAQGLLRRLAANDAHAYNTASRMKEDGLAHPIVLTGGMGYDLTIASVTSEGMRRIGEWSDVELRDAVLAVIEQSAQEAPEDERPALRRAAGWLGGAGSDVMRRVLTEYLTRHV